MIVATLPPSVRSGSQIHMPLPIGTAPLRIGTTCGPSRRAGPEPANVRVGADVVGGVGRRRTSEDAVPSRPDLGVLGSTVGRVALGLRVAASATTSGAARAVGWVAGG